MSLREVPMWRVECDKCGDGEEGEFWAWNDHGHAIDDWVNWENYFTDNGKAFHNRCVPFERCPELTADEGHTWESNGDCGEGCGRTVIDVLLAAGWQPTEVTQ